MDTILLLDIGNTNVKIGLARPGQGLASTYALPTAPGGHMGTADSWGLALLGICRAEGLDPGEVADMVACSVVPPMNPILAAAAKRYFGQPGQRLRFVPEDIPLAIENRYARPQEVGADRLVTAFAARAATKAHSVVVVDFGTATTFDCVQGGAYLGGLICPGVLSSARALATGTAKLPHITLEIDPEAGLAIGRSTAESLNQGLIHGFAAMVEGLAARLAQALGITPGDEHIIATGGFARVVSRVCPAIDEVREDLLMEGLFLAARAAR